MYAPFSILAFFSVASFQESNSIRKFQSNIEKKVSTSFLKTLLADCTLWPFVNFVNFRFIPISYRPSFVAMAQLLWQTYLSTVSHSNESNTDDTPAENDSNRVPNNNSKGKTLQSKVEIDPASSRQ